MRKILFVIVPVLALAGCRTSYSWTSDVPKNLRTVSVPTFRNESDITELGVSTPCSPTATRTFRIKAP